MFKRYAIIKSHNSLEDVVINMMSADFKIKCYHVNDNNSNIDKYTYLILIDKENKNEFKLCYIPYQQFVTYSEAMQQAMKVVNTLHDNIGDL